MDYALILNSVLFFLGGQFNLNCCYLRTEYNPNRICTYFKLGSVFLGWSVQFELLLSEDRI